VTVYVDPLTVRCPYCATVAGGHCTAEPSLRQRRPHAARTRFALEMAAHSDPALDAFPGFGPTSPCGICGSGLPQRHRVVDAIAGRLAAGESEEEVAADYDLPLEAARLVGEWARKWGVA
jgi:hypothetical protein